MTDQPDEGSQSRSPADPTSPLDFDPYRYGKPDYPVPPEYAPPGYVPPGHVPPGYVPPGSVPPGSVPPAPQDPTGQQPVWPPSDAQQQPPPPAPQGQYGPYPPYGYVPHPPPPPGYPSYGTVRPSTGRATTAMVLGILSLVFFWLTFLDLGLAIPAIVLGALAMRDARRSPERVGHGKGLAGVICGSIAVLLVIVTLVVVYIRIRPCLHPETGGVSQSCVNDRL